VAVLAQASGKNVFGTDSKLVLRSFPYKYRDVISSGEFHGERDLHVDLNEYVVLEFAKLELTDVAALQALHGFARKPREVYHAEMRYFPDHHPRNQTPGKLGQRKRNRCSSSSLCESILMWVMSARCAQLVDSLPNVQPWRTAFCHTATLSSAGART
jgi:hypothetical protein